MRKNKNQIVCDRLNEMELSEKARAVIDATDFNVIDKLFGHLHTAEDVEEYVAECFAEDDEC